MNIDIEAIKAKVTEGKLIRGVEVKALIAEVERLKVERDAAVEDLSTYKDCGFCIHLQDQQYCYKNCQRHVDVDNFRTHPCWQWRGPQVAGKGDSNG